MKKLLILSFMFGLFSCHHSADVQHLQKQIDSLKNELANVYKPGFGFLMNNMQIHHAKLWFAGINKNWELARFEVKELKEITVEIQKYQSRRKETKLMDMLSPELINLSMIIEEQNAHSFKKAFTHLTRTCNECHKLTDFEYNIVKVPESPEFSNQEFKIK